MPRGGLKLTFKVEDDYGVVSAETPHPSRAAQGRKDRRRPGPARSQEGRAPAARAAARAGAAAAARHPKQAEGPSFHEIGDHPWAGMKVR